MTGSLQIWSPGFDPSSGGIQRFAGQIREACGIVFPDARIMEVSPKFPFHFVNKITFAARAVAGALLRRPRAVVCMHLHFLPLLLAARRLVPMRVYVVLHGQEAWHPRRRPSARSARLVDAWWCASDFTRNHARKWLPESATAKVLHPCVDDERFRPLRPGEQRWGVSDFGAEDTLLLTVGRLGRGAEFKGHGTVLRALRLVLPEFPSLRYVVAGDGPGRGELTGLAEQLGVGERVTFLGRVPEEELPGLYRAARVFAMPSAREGFGIVFIEAAASGCAVIGGDADGTREALLGGALGMLVPAGSVPDLADAIRKSLLHPPGPEVRERLIAVYGKRAFQSALGKLLQNGRTAL